MSDSPQSPASQRSHLPRILFYMLVLLLVVGAVAYYGYVVRASRPGQAITELDGLRTFISKIPQNQKLAAGYHDADGDGVADTPTDPKKLQKVEEISFSLVAG